MECIACPAGTYAPAYRSLNCSDCMAGTYQDDVGQKDCVLCPSGTYSENDRRTSSDACKICVNIQPGNYCPPATSDRGGMNCPAGKYRPSIEYATTKCMVCPAGRYALPHQTGLVECTQCALGYYCKTSYSVLLEGQCPFLVDTSLFLLWYSIQPFSLTVYICSLHSLHNAHSTCTSHSLTV